MPATHSFFQRVGSLFRANGNGNGHSNGAGHNGLGGKSVAADVVSPVTRSELAPSARPTKHPRESIWKRRHRSKEELRAGYMRTVELMTAMQEHFRQQDRRAAELIASVERIGETLRDTADQQRIQNESIARIAKGVENGAGHVERLSLVLDELPAALLQHSEAVKAVAQQMESSRETDAKLGDSLDRFGNSVETLRESGATQVAALERVQLEQRDERKALREFVQIQSRRFALTTALAGTLGIASIGATLYVLMRVMS